MIKQREFFLRVNIEGRKGTTRRWIRVHDRNFAAKSIPAPELWPTHRRRAFNEDEWITRRGRGEGGITSVSLTWLAIPRATGSRNSSCPPTGENPNSFSVWRWKRRFCPSLIREWCNNAIYFAFHGERRFVYYFSGLFRAGAVFFLK